MIGAPSTVLVDWEVDLSLRMLSLKVHTGLANNGEPPMTSHHHEGVGASCKQVLGVEGQPVSRSQGPNLHSVVEPNGIGPKILNNDRNLGELHVEIWFFYASSACIYPKFKQLETNVSLKESDAWPAEPQDAYGLEKLATEELCKHDTKDFVIECRIGRFHNIYGPFGTWKGGREKAPAAFCRKAITSADRFEMWGDGLQTRSFTFIDECVEGVLRLTKSDFREPVNIGSDEMVSMNEIILSFEDKKLPIQHIPGPKGVRGRNSDNTLIKEKLGWAPTMKLKDGLKITYFWIKEQIEKEKTQGSDVSIYGSSKVVGTQAPVQLGSLRAADGKE